MTLLERQTDAQTRAQALIQQRQQLVSQLQQVERALIGLDSELALLEQLVKDASDPPVRKGRKPVAVVS